MLSERVVATLSFTTKSCACVSIAFLVGRVSWSADSAKTLYARGSQNVLWGFQGIRGFNSVIASLKFTNFLIKEIVFKIFTERLNWRYFYLA